MQNYPHRHSPPLAASHEDGLRYRAGCHARGSAPCPRGSVTRRLVSDYTDRWRGSRT
jgi:hypothetical protein